MYGAETSDTLETSAGGWAAVCRVSRPRSWLMPLIHARTEALARRDFRTADRCRNELRALCDLDIQDDSKAKRSAYHVISCFH